ncbi:hypothetical protein [Streptomyces wuyuanensis]|uniref:hypothetical protein n=1 Tax=Streptomyces wuyuanensis TaxID=1196353 RepID=UPI00371BFD57
MEASTEECTAGSAAAGSEGGTAGEPAKDAAKVTEPVEASADEATVPVGAEEDAEGCGTTAGAGSGSGEAPAASAAADASGPSDPAGSSGAEHVEIPKQQSVDEAADNEAGEGARK